MKIQCTLSVLGSALLASCSLSATELYNLDFTPPEVGIYQIVYGSPSVQSSVGPFADALVFHAVTSFDQIQLPIGVTSPHYDIQYDVLTHNLLNSQYDFSISLDGFVYHSVGFHGGLDGIEVYEPSPYTVEDVADFLDDEVYHVGISLDLTSNSWSVAVDGAEVFTSPLNSSSLDSIRFSLNPWVGGAVDAPGTYVALDNVVVTAVPEPSSGAVALVAALLASARVRFHRRTASLPAVHRL